MAGGIEDACVVVEAHAHGRPCAFAGPNRFLAAALVFGVAASSAPAVRASNAGDRGTVRIGLLMPWTGALKRIGGDANGGFRYYLAAHGDRLGGFKVEVRTGDEGDSVASALQSARQLVEEDKVDVVVGIATTEDAYGVVDYLAARKAPVIVAVAGADGVTQDGRKMLMRVAHTSSQDMMPLGDYVCRRLGKRTAGMLAVDNEYGAEAAGGFARAYIAAGCRIVAEQYFPVGASAYAPIVAKMNRTADVVFAATGDVDATPLLAAYHAAFPKRQLIGDGALTDENLLPGEHDSALGVITGLHYAPSLPGAANAEFRVGYEALNRLPATQYAENGYDAAAVLDLALAGLAGRTVRPDAVMAILHAVSFRAPRGPVHFDSLGQVNNNVYIRKVTDVDGRLRNSVIATYPSVGQFWKWKRARYLKLPSYGKLKGTWVSISRSEQARP